MRQAIYRLVPWLLAALVCLGCFKAPAQQAAPSIYTLTAAKRSGETLQPIEATLAIGRLKAVAVLRTNRMLKQNGHQIKYTANHLWGAPPALMLADFLTSYLEQSGMFRAVWQAGLMPTPDFTLSGFIDSFQAVSGDKGWNAVLGVNIILERKRLPAGKPEIIFQKHYQLRVPMVDFTPPALAKAMSEAALAFGRMVTTDVAQAVRQTP